MSPLFHVSELLQIGVEDERTGVSFYSALARKTKNPALRKTYETLTEQERRHQERFQKMLDAVPDDSPTEAYPGEYIAYLRAMLESRAFPDEATGRRLAEEAADDRAALLLALRFERDTLILLNELRNMVPARDRATVDELAREEQSHLVELNRALDQL